MAEVGGLQYAGKRVIVVGAASGVGAATARLLIDLGAEVHAIDAERPDYSGYASASVCGDDVEVDATIVKIGHVVNALFVCAGTPPVAAAVPLMLDDAAIATVGEPAAAPVRSNSVVPNDAASDDVAWVLAFLNSPRAAAVDGVIVELSRPR